MSVENLFEIRFIVRWSTKCNYDTTSHLSDESQKLLKSYHLDTSD